MKILTLNIQQGGGSRIENIIASIINHKVDTIVLTEFRQNKNTVQIINLLEKYGYMYHSSSSSKPKENSVFIASKYEFQTKLFPNELVNDKHRLLLAKFKTVNIVGVYFAQQEKKAKLFDFINNNILSLLNDRGIIIGDFNTGKFYIDEKDKTFSCVDKFTKLEENGLIDSWRSRNKNCNEYSWYSYKGNGFRIDHIFSTKSIDKDIKQIYYSHKERENKISDHSAMIVEI